jgi:two-component system, NarL family, captular synthesis response regulator RcsB
MPIVVSDDHPIVVMGVRAFLTCRLPHCEVAADAYSGKQLLGVLAAAPYDVCITAYFGPGEPGSVHGLPLLKELRQRHAGLAIVVLTTASNPTLVQCMFDAGADAVVDKTATLDELVHAVQIVRSGHRYISEGLRPRVTEHRDAPAPEASKPSLSPREAEVVHWLAHGLSVSEVARQTARSVKTISQQKHNAMRKLGFDRDADLYEYACAAAL